MVFGNRIPFNEAVIQPWTWCDADTILTMYRWVSRGNRVRQTTPFVLD